MIKRALISVSKKDGILDMSRALVNLGVEIISTGGTARILEQAGVKVTGISEITGFPECLDGRVKTLHPNVHGGLLAVRDNPEHMRQIEDLGIRPIDMLIINLYPFKETILKPRVTLEDAIENIDIGGPAMLRAAAKNYQDVAVVIDPADYIPVICELTQTGDISIETKFKLAYKVFEHTSHYDALICGYLRGKLEEEGFPQTFTPTFEKIQEMRYGENPHQKAAFYREPVSSPGALTNALQLHGKELSYNNINDTNGAIELLKEFDEPSVVAVKHANPCGVASRESIYEAYLRAYEADPVSIYGGIVAANREIDKRTAEEMSKIFLEIVIAPSYSDEALLVLKKKKNMRILQLKNIADRIPEGTFDMKKVSGGILVQSSDTSILHADALKVVTKKSPSKKELEDLVFAMKVVKHTKSNGISLAKDKQTLGIGPGQANR
ncbi:MAG: bifunctional phosphoribosylaminoimidazolecarboxamide formyltransferase/IMP cyclohydrolase, partial [Eubacteriales bacterium]|nr:bifunctional phosphoribosylaminoimidazolecarboxamide formyltransferase/IMP cyclohydrolase [Eubacteriales bacterium]